MSTHGMLLKKFCEEKKKQLLKQYTIMCKMGNLYECQLQFDFPKHTK